MVLSSSATFYNKSNDDFKSVLPPVRPLTFGVFLRPNVPEVIKEQQQKYIFQTGTNRLDYYRDGLNTKYQKEEVGMITYARRQESE